MPTSMLMNLDANTLQEKYFRLQLDAARPLKKQMWKNVVENKIKNQAGLLKCLGIFHRNYYDAFPLADDIMEPYRPFVDHVVFQLSLQKKKNLDKETKHKFMELYYTEVPSGEQRVQLGTCLTYTTVSVAKFFMGETKNISYPRISCGS